MEKMKWLLSILCGLLSAFTKQYGMIIAFVCIAVVFDWITGIIGEKAVGHAITSKKGTIGFWKKMALFAALFFGFFFRLFYSILLGKNRFRASCKCTCVRYDNRMLHNYK